MTDIKDFTAAYRRLNTSYRPILVWHIGVDAGFFAEYTAMLHAMLYCLEHKLQFRLYSDDANFSVEKGWTDFFEPFCREEHHTFHSKYNLHGVAPSWRNILKLRGAERRQMAVWKLKLKYRHFIGNLNAWLCYRHRVCLSHTVHFNLHHHFCIPELGIDGDYFHAFSRMVDITWRFNDAVAAETRNLVANLKMGDNVAGCQIRGGDKVTETELLPPEAYVEAVRRDAIGSEVFVLTDDYKLFTRAKEIAPDISWHTLCQPSETGYVNAGFTHTSADRKRTQMVRFLASMQILRSANPFFGSITPGPSLFILKLRHPDGIAMDCPQELRSEALRLPIAGRSRIAQESVRKSSSKLGLSSHLH